MKFVSIPCLFDPDESGVNWRDLGLDDREVPISEAEEIIVDFTRVDAISDYFEDGEEFTELYVNGSSFLTRYKKDKVKELFNDL